MVHFVNVLITSRKQYMKNPKILSYLNFLSKLESRVKYLKPNKMPKKHTPWHVKGVYNYRNLLKKFDLEDEYEDIYEGSKARVVYLKRNKFNVDILTYQRWPREFDKWLQIDHDKMIDKFFLKKIGFLLEPMNKMELLSGEKEKTINSFFV